MDIFKPIERICPWIVPPKSIAITLWPFIFYKTKEASEDRPLKEHEYFHWKQALRWGVIPWYIAYLVLLPFYIRKRPDDHPMERQAYDIQRRVTIALATGLGCECGKTVCDCTERGDCCNNNCGCSGKT